MYFNHASRQKNILNNSFWGIASNCITVLLAFAYRTLFLRILTAEYLGLNGLFSNILQILSLADLGIHTAIVFRFYDPIANDDVAQVGRLMNYFRRVYTIIALSIAAIGLLIMPWIRFLIKDASEIPSDINLYVIYSLFLINTLSSYLFAYKFSLLTVDQKQYLLTLLETLRLFAMYTVQIILLVVFHNYTWSLGSGIIVTILTNFTASQCITRKYKEVFQVKESLNKEEQRQILTDTGACMMHRIGTVVLNGTDNAVLTKMVSLAAAGIYSNYAMILSCLRDLLSQLLGNFTAIIGNARISLSKDEYYALFKRLKFVTCWIAASATVCLYSAIDDFICIWAGPSYVFEKMTTVFLCIYFYMSITRLTETSFTNAGGWFVKDKIRPLIEATLNLGTSIYLTRLLGIAGVFMGTVFSFALTAFWRQPYILFHLDFHRPHWEYWLPYAEFAAITLVTCVLQNCVVSLLPSVSRNLLFVFIETFLPLVLCNLLLFLLFRRSSEFQYLKESVCSFVLRVLKKGTPESKA